MENKLDEIDPIDYSIISKSFREIKLEHEYRKKNYSDTPSYINLNEYDFGYFIYFPEEILFKYTHLAIINCLKKLNNFYQRRSRLRKKIAEIVKSGNYCFLTLTFSDLSSSSVETRRGYVRKFLNQSGCDYVANIDYGSEGRP